MSQVTMIRDGRGQAVKDDGGKAKLSLIDPGFIEAMARVLGFGEEKYGPANWMAGLSYSRVIDSARRHLSHIEKGQDFDSDTGEQHAIHAACCVMYLNYFIARGRYDLDDRRFKHGATVPEVQEGVSSEPVLPESPAEGGLHLQEVRHHGQVEASPGEGKAEEGVSAGTQEPLRALQDRIAAWADTVIPNRTPEDALRKLIMEEIPELLCGGTKDPQEYADILILVLDIAKLNGIDPVEAGHAKMAVNETRQWEINEKTGLLRHVE